MKWKKWLPSKRKIMQLYFAVLFNANLKGFVTGNIYQGNTKKMCVPGINCYSCPGATGACPLGSLQGSFSADHSTIYYVCGILLIYCLIFGRMICGWLCPFGLVQELAYKIKTPKLKKSPVTRILSFLKYAILVFFVLIVPITYALRDVPLPAFCKYICPAGTLEGGIGLLANKVNESYFSMLGPLFTWKFLLMVSILIGCIFVFRLFCRFICPLGALYGLFNKLSFFGIRVNRSKCVDCGKCIHTCKMDIRHVGDAECISCGECVDVCPTKAIQWKGPKIFLKPNETEAAPETKANKHKTARIISRCISATLLLALLVGAIWYYWPTESDFSATPSTNTQDTTVPTGNVPAVGSNVGDLCASAELTIVDGSGDTTGVIDPSKTGTVTVINFWGTWCGPCVNELPYFHQIAEEYANQITVIAIHSGLKANETEADYIAEHYPDTNIIFSKDTGDLMKGDFYNALGGRGTYPYTVVLDENGIITNIVVSSLTYDELKEMVTAQMN